MFNEEIFGMLRRSVDRKLLDLEPGLIKITYQFNGDHTAEELALIATPSLADCLGLPNNALQYRFFLRDSMKNANMRGVKGIKPFGAIGGLEFHDQHIESVEGRTIKLAPSFYDFKKNHNHLVVGCNSPYFKDTIAEIARTLSGAGFNAEDSTWDDYKTWEIGKLKEF